MSFLYADHMNSMLISKSAGCHLAIEKPSALNCKSQSAGLMVWKPRDCTFLGLPEVAKLGFFKYELVEFSLLGGSLAASDYAGY